MSQDCASLCLKEKLRHFSGPLHPCTRLCTLHLNLVMCVRFAGPQQLTCHVQHFVSMFRVPQLCDMDTLSLYFLINLALFNLIMSMYCPPRCVSLGINFLSSFCPRESILSSIYEYVHHVTVNVEKWRSEGFQAYSVFRSVLWPRHLSKNRSSRNSTGYSIKLSFEKFSSN
jgi:hypothetical protein